MKGNILDNYILEKELLYTVLDYNDIGTATNLI